MSKAVTVAIVDDSRDLRENIGGYLSAFPRNFLLASNHTADAADLAREVASDWIAEKSAGRRLDGILTLGENATDGHHRVRARALKTLVPDILADDVADRYLTTAKRFSRLWPRGPVGICSNGSVRRSCWQRSGKSWREAR